MQKFYRSDNRLIWGDNNRQLKQRGRRRQRQKTNRFRMSKQQHAFFFVHFIARLRRENALCRVLSRGREHKTTTFFLIS